MRDDYGPRARMDDSLQQPDPNIAVPSVTTGGTEAARPESRCTCRIDSPYKFTPEIIRCAHCLSIEAAVDALRIQLHAALARAQQLEETIARLNFERRKC